MSAQYPYEPLSFSFTNVNTITIEHNFGRDVTFKLIIDDNIAEAKYTPIDNDSFKLEFYEKGNLIQKSGKVIVT